MGHYWLFNIENSWFLDPSNVPSGTTDTIFPLIYSHHVGHPTSYHCTENGPFQMGENIDHSKTLTITLTVHANPGQTWNQNSNFAKYLTWVFTYRNCTINWFTDNFKHIWKANSLSIYHSAETSKVSRVWIPGWKIFYFCRQIQRQFFHHKPRSAVKGDLFEPTVQNTHDLISIKHEFAEIFIYWSVPLALD